MVLGNLLAIFTVVLPAILVCVSLSFDCRPSILGEIAGNELNLQYKHFRSSQVDVKTIFKRHTPRQTTSIEDDFGQINQHIRYNLHIGY